MKRTIFSLLMAGAMALPIQAMAQQMTAATAPLTTADATTDVVMSGQNLSKSSIRQIQQSLAERGFYSGKVTGQWDDSTTAALSAFQKKAGESGPTDGSLIKASTLAKLNVALKPTPEPSDKDTSRISRDTSRSANVTGGLIAGQPTPAGQTVKAPDNGTKSTLTRNAVASGRFDSTIDGKAALGSATPSGPQNSGTAGIGNEGNESLSGGTSLGATASTTGTLGGTGSPSSTTGTLSGEGTAQNNVSGRPGTGSPPTTSSALGGGAANSLAPAAGSNSGGASGSLGGGSSAGGSGGGAGGGM